MRIVGLVLVLALVAISAWGVNQYVQKSRYENYFSQQVLNDIAGLSYNVFNNQQIYDDILAEGAISFEQAETLHNSNNFFMVAAQEYQQMARQLKLLCRDDVNNLPALNASSISFYFERLLWDIAEEEGIDTANRMQALPYELPATKAYELEESELAKIELISELNTLWLEAVAQHVPGFEANGRVDSRQYFDTYSGRALTAKYWVELMQTLDKQTDHFLKENALLEIRSVLY